MATRRQLTSGAASSRNHGQDTAENDLVICEGDLLVNTSQYRRYKVHSMLGCGTFGQVALCSTESGLEVAVKVIKNQPAYFNQAIVEARILKLLNETHDPTGEHHVVRILDYFVHASHLCIVFERLHANLYEVLKWNHYRGLSLSLVSIIVKQILECLVVLRRAGIIHCDLKPENVLLASTTTTACRVIDFGSACFEGRTVYSYIQSRFYRSPEVILGHPYNSLVDMWSLGCIAAELFLGLPLFPGASDYDMLRRIDAYIGAAPAPFLLRASLAPRSYIEDAASAAAGGGRRLRLMTAEEYAAQHRAPPDLGKQYFKHLNGLPEAETSLEDVLLRYPMPEGVALAEAAEEHARRQCFADFLRGVLTVDPAQRCTPWQALQHPFLTGAPFTGPFTPPPEPSGARPAARPSAPKAMPAAPPPQPAHGKASHAMHSGVAPATPSPAASCMHYANPSGALFGGGAAPSVGAATGHLYGMSVSSRGAFGARDVEQMPRAIPQPGAALSLGSSVGTMSLGPAMGSSVGTGGHSGPVHAMHHQGSVAYGQSMNFLASSMDLHGDAMACAPVDLLAPSVSGRDGLWPHAHHRHRGGYVYAQPAHLRADAGSLGTSYGTELGFGESPALAGGLPVLGTSSTVFAGHHAPLGYGSSAFSAHGRHGHASASGGHHAARGAPAATRPPAASATCDAASSRKRRSLRGNSHRLSSGGDFIAKPSDSPQTVSGGGGANDWDPFFLEAADEVSGPTCVSASAASAPRPEVSGASNDDASSGGLAAEARPPPPPAAAARTAQSASRRSRSRGRFGGLLGDCFLRGGGECGGAMQHQAVAPAGCAD